MIHPNQQIILTACSQIHKSYQTHIKTLPQFSIKKISKRRRCNTSNNINQQITRKRSNHHRTSSFHRNTLFVNASRVNLPFFSDRWWQITIRLITFHDSNWNHKTFRSQINYIQSLSLIVMHVGLGNLELRMIDDKLTVDNGNWEGV